MEKPERPKGMRSRPYRWVTASLGLFFIVLAGAMVCTATDHKLSTYGCAVIVGGLGIDAVISAARNRLSFLARIGPLP